MRVLRVVTLRPKRFSAVLCWSLLSNCSMPYSMRGRIALGSAPCETTLYFSGASGMYMSVPFRFAQDVCNDAL